MLLEVVEPKRSKSPEPPMPFASNEQAQEAVREWLQFKREKNQRYKPTGLKGLYRTMVEMGPQRTIAAIHHSIAGNYAGLVDPKNGALPHKTPYRPINNGDAVTW